MMSYYSITPAPQRTFCSVVELPWLNIPAGVAPVEKKKQLLAVDSLYTTSYSIQL